MEKNDNSNRELGMNQEELIRDASKSSGISQAMLSDCCKALVASMVRALENGIPVRIRTLGTLSPVTKEPRTCRNPRTGEKVISKKHTTIVFRPSNRLKQK